MRWGLAVLVVAAIPLACATLKASDVTLPGSSSDASADDSSASADGELDGGGAFCTTLTPAADFCEDFDDGELEKGFINALANPDLGESGGGTIGPGTDLPSSFDGTRYIDFALPVLMASTNTAGAELMTELPFVPTNFIIMADVRITSEDIPAAGTANPLDPNVFLISSIWSTPTSTTTPGAFFVSQDAVGTSLVLFDDANELPPARLKPSLALGGWTELKLILYNEPRDGGTDGELDIYVNGVRAGEVKVPANFQTTTTPPKVQFGASTVGPMGAFQLSVDNVRMYWSR